MENLRRSKLGTWLFLASFFTLLGFYVYGYLNPPNLELGYSKEILGNRGELLYTFLSPDDKWRLETDDHQLPKRLKDWILWKEDKWFYQHPGVNPISVLQSSIRNLWAGKRLSGASTITMQAVKMHDRKPRTWWAKIQESISAIRWECGLSKDQIFRYYLSNLPFGGNVEGFRAASLLYFGKEPIQLSIAESAALVVIPNHPNRLHPLRSPENLKNKRNQFLRKLYDAQLINEAELKSATLEPIYASFHKMPNEAPHLAQHLAKEPTFKAETTVDRAIQRQMAQLLSSYALRMKRFGIANASLLVANIKTREIVAWIGNPDFYDNQNAGQVNGVMAIRSPGSTLKPIVYGLGLQKGLITPKTLLYDVPTEFGTYLPENFDPKFLGAVTAEDALIQSLNIPAIGLLKEIGVDTLMSYTDKLGMQLLRNKTTKPGLSMAVGGCGTTLFELVQAYAALANHGQFVPLLVQKTTEKSSPTPSISPSASMMIQHMLSSSKRQEAILPFVENPEKYGAVCWKTGTSFGHRDAWCIGFGSRYVVGVWFGNFSGEGRSALSGIDVAAPVFQQVIATLEGKIPSPKLPEPSYFGWKERKVCRKTGLPPGPKCIEVVTDLFLPLISKNTICNHVKSYAVNSSESLHYCPQCLPDAGTHTLWLENYPTNYIQFLQSKGEKVNFTPQHNPACPLAGTGASVQIVSPAPGKEFYLETLEFIHLPIKAITSSGDYPMRFYANGQWVGESKRGEEIRVKFGQGKYRLVATDSRGMSGFVTFSVNAF